MKLKEIDQAVEGKITIRLPHNMSRGDGYVTVDREVEVSDLSVCESGLVQYTCYMAGVGRHVLTRVSGVVEVESVCTIEDWNAACDHWDVLHDMHGLRGF